jgi:pimeloyl-ACP methyl ester carboxylesterase
MRAAIGLMLGVAITLPMAACRREASERNAALSDEQYRVDTGETIRVLAAGTGEIPVLLLAGNNCSGSCFHALLDSVCADRSIAERYTFYAVDYRGSGGSTYERPIETLDDFAADIEGLIRAEERLQRGAIILVGHSMGFGVAQCLVARRPESFHSIVSLAGIGTRGVRVPFFGAAIGTDPRTGQSYRSGDWADSLSAVAFHQRSLLEENRTADAVSARWNLMVFNEILEWNPQRGSPGDTEYLSHP